MRPETTADLEPELAELRSALSTLKAPDEIRARCEHTLDQRSTKQPRAPRWRWSLAASLVAAVLLASLLRNPTVESTTEPSVKYIPALVITTEVPVITYSLAHGIEMDFASAIVETDQAGTQRIVYMDSWIPEN
ncbi:MAG: hypothetical protein AAFX10_11435 [Pseudomonadota bacterium]